MNFFFLYLAVMVGSFLIVRSVCLDTRAEQPSHLKLFLVGMATWVFLLSALGWLILPLYLVFVLLVMGNMAAIAALMFIGVVTGLVFWFNELLDSASVLHYMRESAFFRTMRPQNMHFQEELDKKRIRDVHRETSDKPFPTIGKRKRLLTEEEIDQYKQEVNAAKERPTRSRLYDEEIASLKSGAVTSIADAWKVYTFNHKPHDFYTEMSQLQIDPNARALQFKLNVPNAAQRALRDPMYAYKLKQELYHLFSVLHTDPWLTSYSEFFDRIITVCYGIEPDSFGQVQVYPFMKIDIANSELHQREGKFFNAADLHKISTLTFNNGKHLPDEFP